MTVSIAVAGKGGSGKTSLVSLIIRYLEKNGDGPVLAVDADPNSNLGESLGLEVGETVGSIIAAFNEEKINIPLGMTKETYLEYQLNRALVESRGLDLMTMGRGEGPECYCYPNLMLRRFIDSLAGNYAYLVMDNEAGMEHLSRRTTQGIDELLIVSNHSVKGVRTVVRIEELVAQLKLRVKRISVIVNLAPPELDPLVREELSRLKIEPRAVIPLDSKLARYDLEMRPLPELPDSSAAVAEVNDLMAGLLS
ncbi:MAG: AAA family ATPase [Dehalococcoidales bacterium]|nr:AAA family ATPase [Dehalococcoidales bacterium]